MTALIYDDIDIRMYLAFSTQAALDDMLEKSNLPDDEKEAIKGCVSKAHFTLEPHLLLATHRKPGKDLPPVAYLCASAIYEMYPYEMHFNIRKAGEIDLSTGLHDFGYDLVAYEGRLQAFKA